MPASEGRLSWARSSSPPPAARRSGCCSGARFRGWPASRSIAATTRVPILGRQVRRAEALPRHPGGRARRVCGGWAILRWSSGDEGILPAVRTGRAPAGLKACH